MDGPQESTVLGPSGTEDDHDEMDDVDYSPASGDDIVSCFPSNVNVAWSFEGVLRATEEGRVMWPRPKESGEIGQTTHLLRATRWLAVRRRSIL